MKNKLVSLLLASAAFAAQPAMADVIIAGSQLNTGGTVSAMGSTGTLDTATGLDFLSGGIDFGQGTAGLLAGATGSGDFNFVNCSVNPAGTPPQLCGFISDITSFAPFAPNPQFLFGLPGGISFSLDSPLTVLRAAATPTSLATLILSGQGTLSATGFDNTNGIFTLVTQGGLNTTFSASIVSLGGPVPPTGVPEPTSLLLIGVGLAGSVFARRRKAPQA